MKEGVRRQQVSSHLDVDAELLTSLAHDPFDEPLVRLDAPSRRAPDARRKMRLADQRETLVVVHEQGHVVPATRVVSDQPELALADLAFPVEDRRIAERRADGLEDRLVDVHRQRC
jgi:hypothetical protein